MGYSFKPLWKLLAQKGMTKTEFREVIDISTTTLAKMDTDKVISMDVVAKICERLGCKMNEVVVYESEIDLFMNKYGGYFGEHESTIFVDKWPECRFELSERQIAIYQRLGEEGLNQLISKCKLNVKMNIQSNVDIIRETRINFYPSRSTLVIQAPLAVIEMFIVEFLTLTNDL